MKKLFFVFAWFFLTAGVVMISAGSYSVFRAKQGRVIALASKPAQTSQTFTATAKIDPALLGEVKGVSSAIEVDDARPGILANFLKRYSSPLEPYDVWGAKLVEIADRHQIDFRLLPAIAMQESNLCKKIPENTYNCLGFGIHERGTLGFEAYEAGFERAAKELKERYINKGLDTPEKIMKKYTPSSKGSWAASVTQWMNEMRYDDRKLGQENRTDKVHVLEYLGDATPSASSSPSARPLEKL